MGRLVIGYQNRCDESALAGGNWLASAPLANLQDRRISRVARSNGTSNPATQFDVDLGRARRIAVLALVVHNISVVGRVRVQGADSPTFSAPVHDSGWQQVWPFGMIDASLLEWEDDNFWFGTLSDEARAGFQSPYIWRVNPAVTCRYWRVLIDDTSNPDGYIQIGRLFIADAWSPSIGGAGMGASLSYSDASTPDRSLGGTKYFDRQESYRVYRFTLPAITKTEAYSRALEMQRIAGITGEVLVIPDPDDRINMPRRAFVATLQQLSPITQPNGAAMATEFVLEEII